MAGKEVGSSDDARIPYDYSTSPSTPSYVHGFSGRTTYFDSTHYASWKHKMKMHLKSINSSI